MGEKVKDGGGVSEWTWHRVCPLRVFGRFRENPRKRSTTYRDRGMAGDSLLSVYFQGGADRVHALRDKNPRGLLSDSIGVALDRIPCGIKRGRIVVNERASEMSSEPNEISSERKRRRGTSRTSYG